MKLEMELTENEALALLSLLAHNSFNAEEIDTIWRKYSRVFSAHKWGVVA